MSVVDSHIHCWWISRGDYQWLTPADPALYRDFQLEDVQPDLSRAGVSKIVLVQAAPSEAETRTLIGLAHRAPLIAAVVGWTDFEHPNVRIRMRELSQLSKGRLKGSRPMIQDIDDPTWLARPSLNTAFEAMLDEGLTFDALVKPVHLPLLCERLKRYPGLRAVLDHAGKPDIANGGFEKWARDLAALASNRSLHCTLSGRLTQAGGAPTHIFDRFAAHVFRCFGPERIMWGSDWPMVTTSADYAYWFEVARDLVRRHAHGWDDAIFRGNATRFYDFECRP